MEHHLTCSICEALCGLKVEVDDGVVKSIRGNPDDPLSKGYICPKGVALQDLHFDTDRLKRPIKKQGNDWVEISWEEAIEEVAEKLHSTREKYGRRSVGVYSGNPNAHNYSSLLVNSFFHEALRSKSRFSATSADQLPHMFAAFMMFGHQLLLPIPDLERTECFVIMGGNPLASNGSIMTAPNMKRRLKEIQARGGKVIVIDPRRTETAKVADEYHGIRPGTDAFFLAAFLHTIFKEDLVKAGRWQEFSEGIEHVKRAVEFFVPERVAEICGIKDTVITSMARDFASQERAVFYGRIGVCTQEFGGLCSWLLHLINIVTNNFDEPGGSMFTHPAVDLISLSKKTGDTGHYNIWQSRVRGFPEFGGELPVSTMAEEIDTPGEGQIRAMMMIAGNPVLSSPNSARLEEALRSLDFMVSLDMYINETSQHADLIIPPTSPLERDHFGLVFHTLAVRNTVKYSEPLFSPKQGARHDWEVLLLLAERLFLLDGGLRGRLKALKIKTLRTLKPRRILSAALRMGPYGSGLKIFKKGVSLSALKANGNGLDLGPLRRSLPEKLCTRDQRIQMAPDSLIGDVHRLVEKYHEYQEERGTFLLIGRRHLRSNNSWLHNSKRLQGGGRRCTLMINPKDAEHLNIKDQSQVRVLSRVGELTVEIQFSKDLMLGVVSLPHGWGHGKSGLKMKIAQQTPGQNINQLTDDQFIDSLTGNAGFNGLPVEIIPV
jgi:anaerobic selenocysteine-containing dehydrogenase